MKTINDLREALKSEYVGTNYDYSTAMQVGFSAKNLLEENFKNCGLNSRVFVHDSKQSVCLKVRGAGGYDHTFIEIKVKKSRGKRNYNCYGSNYDWTVSDIEVISWQSEKDESGNYVYITDLDRIITKVVEYLEASSNTETKRIKQGADIVEALKKEYNLEHYYEVGDLIRYIDKHFYTIEKEIEARHPELENIL